MVSLPHAPTLNSEDNTAHNRLHISRRNPVIFNYEVSAVPALNNSANSATANKLNREFATDPQWASKRRNTPLKNPSISAVTAVESGPIMVVQWASENGSPTCALKPHTNRKIRKHQHEQHERNMSPGKISTISMNSMPPPSRGRSRNSEKSKNSPFLPSQNQASQSVQSAYGFLNLLSCIKLGFRRLNRERRPKANHIELVEQHAAAPFSLVSVL